ncbi:MAG: hypothetical protein HFE90_11365 [Firmicutes bacterium]|nr:hypothetical protein [Bacillota bacterium]
MKILAHRGYWNNEIERNSYQALETALKNGYGFESDIRDYKGELVISHDMPNENSFKVEKIFKILSEYKNELCFAINIKADGLNDELLKLLSRYEISNYFTFDMSLPQMIEYKDAGLQYYTRQSEYEKDCLLYEKAAGVWIDGFISEEWITEDLIKQHQANGKKVCIVSPDLHGREYNLFWEKLINFKINFNELFLCTDYPDKAKNFFSSIIEG